MSLIHDITSHEAMKNFRTRYQWLYICLTFFGLFIVFRLWHLQIIKGDELNDYSKRNLIKETKIQAPRGIFFDREERILVKNKVGFYLTLKPQFTKDKETTLKAIQPVIENRIKKLLKKIKVSERKHGLFQDVVLKENLSFNEVSFLKRILFAYPGLSVKKVILRKYPLNKNGAQLFGYVGEISETEIKKYNKKKSDVWFEQGDIIGKSGLEREWEEELRGQRGAFYEEVDALGRGQITQFLGLKNKTANQGHHLVLTLDKDLQEASFKSMKRKDPIGERIGAVVAMKTNGEVLAWVSLPSFNPNVFTETIGTKVWSDISLNSYKPFRNKVIQDHYPPGSALKPLIGLIGLHENKISPEEKVLSPGFIKLGRRRWHDHKRGGHGEINLIQAIERSSNTFFYKLGMNLDIDHVAHWASLFQLGQKTGIQLEHEKEGLVPSKTWKLKRTGEPWQLGENLIHAIGQGFWLVTPLQMAVLFNALALEGKVYRPFLVKRIKNSKEEIIKEFKPRLIREIKSIPKAHFQTAKAGMFQVSNGDYGTARFWKIGGDVKFSGKTGTVQIKNLSASEVYQKCENLIFDKRHHGWFAGYAPSKAPEIVVVVFTQHSCHGSTGSVPVARDIMRAYLKKYRPELMKKKVLKKGGKSA